MAKTDTEQSAVVSQKRTCIHGAELQVCTIAVIHITERKGCFELS